ncbi:putative metalloprotease CJM1_0395 family protein [Gallaecimonas sp. GXIMD4217]|uniref:putative metalloprotease CJM1_0395 family protein n=1 Tax=Gallaecimonas sp. GXIMD4217 TaxID=3131927 RepID=UPI00311AEC68
MEGLTATPQAAAGAALDPAQRQQVAELKARDREVRSHEQAHLNAAGPYAQGVSYGYEKGPDGRRYAVTGEVAIDASEVAGDPQATLEKAEQIHRAALAPVEPSAQDRRVAAEAIAMANRARQQLLREAPEQQALTGSASGS